jgi:hypothetical protein
MNINSFRGTSLQLGRDYGLFYQREIAGFFSQEFDSYKHRAGYVRRCLTAIDEQAPHCAAFLRGMTKSSLLTEEEHVLLMLHEEEFYHWKLSQKSPHCSAIGLGGELTASGAVLGQNWDWGTGYFPWMSLNRFVNKRSPEILAVSFPGLPGCAGLNANGFSLMWTGAGYYPPLIPIAGIPTYALVFEMLHQPDVETAIAYLQSVRNAGAFIFFLGDKSGDVAVVEAVPGKVFVTRTPIAHRANVFESKDTIAAARQRLPIAKKCHSRIRCQIFETAERELSRRPSVTQVKSVLSKPNILIERGHSHATLMQLVADCETGTLHYRPWRQSSNDWRQAKV